MTINSGGIVHAPWDNRQIEMIKLHQTSGMYHPYTCGMDHDGVEILIPTPGGFICPVVECSYTQKWCHSFSVVRDEWYSV